MEFRTYEDGDEVRLASVFNLCFPYGIRRTGASWRWRFMNRPGFDPEGVIIAEERGEVQGYVVALPRKPHLYKGRRIMVVHGDDLCVLPAARGAGLGTRLVRGLMSYAEKEQALLLGYVGRGDVAHKIYAALGWADMDEWVYLRRVGGMRQRPPPDQSSKHATIRKLSEMKFDEVLNFLNSRNARKIPSPFIDRAEYEWRYLMYENCNSDSVFLVVGEGKVVGHVAVSKHPTSEGQDSFVILSEPCGEIQKVLESTNAPFGSQLNVVISNRTRPQYESTGFTVAGTGVVIVVDYTGLDILKDTEGAEWYLFPESIFGAP